MTQNNSSNHSSSQNEKKKLNAGTRQRRRNQAKRQAELLEKKTVTNQFTGNRTSESKENLSQNKSSLQQKRNSDQKKGSNHNASQQTDQQSAKKKKESNRLLKKRSEQTPKKNNSENKKKKNSKVLHIASLTLTGSVKNDWASFNKKQKIIFVILSAVALMIISGLLFFLIELITTPKLDLDKFTMMQGSKIFDKNGEYYQSFESEEYREVVTLDTIPEHVRNAFVDIEDQRFYSHSGVDMRGLGRALVGVLSSASLQGPGGSTITQQLVKQTFLSSEKTINRKAHEMIMARRLERVYSKDQILEAYLNKINLGQAWGIQSASKTYFNKDVSQLTLAQGAMLAAMPKSPAYFDPLCFDDNANLIREEDGRCKLSEENRDRAIIVLDKMFELKHITQEQHDEAIAQIQGNQVGLTFNPQKYSYSSFTDALYNQLIDDIMQKEEKTADQAADMILNGGIMVYSTIDPEVQKAMEEATVDDSLFPGQSGAAEQASAAKSADDQVSVNYIPQVGMTVIDNETGGIAGMVGGRGEKTNLSLNRAVRRFQPGSSTKPLTTYGPGLDTGAITLGTVYNDTDIYVGDWNPQNSGGGHQGVITVRSGIVQSLNTIAVQACFATGLETCASYAEKVGLHLDRSVDVNPAALALGGYSEGQTTLDMASAFSSFANGGVHKSYSYYTKVTDAKGNVILENKTEETAVYSPQTAFLITDVLQQAVNGGTTYASVGQPVAGKTGTTDDERHAWICGYTPYYSMAVWYGYDENYVETTQGSFELNIGITGGSKPGPAAMFERVMYAINSGKPEAAFRENPGNIYSASIDTKSGKLATDLSVAAGHAVTEMFIEGTGPQVSDDTHYSAKICTASNMLAGKYCPANLVKDQVFYHESNLFPPEVSGSNEANEAPSQTCTLHLTPTPKPTSVKPTTN